jgi:large subunit ribosomal protein L32e
MRKHPKFTPQNYGRKKRVKIRWRRPRGIDSKQRIFIAHIAASPMIGWRSPRNSRGLHPSGLPEVLICSESDMSKLKGMGAKCVGRISARIGKRKRDLIEKQAIEMGVRLVNAKSNARRGAKPEAKKKSQVN